VGTSGVKGVLVRDEPTGLPIKIHPTIINMFPTKKENPYYTDGTLSIKSGGKLKQPEMTWSNAANISVSGTWYDTEEVEKTYYE